MLKIESHRHQVMLVGENLGTVPQYINAAMAQHRLYRMYVVQYALTPESDPALPVVCSDTVASLNTHDMPPFAAYCQGLDIDDRLQQGLLDPRAAGREHRQRLAMLKALQQFLAQHGYIVPSTADIRALLEGCLAYLSASAAEVVLMNLEDLWLETRPQNFPGTRDERLNWQAKARYPLEQMTQMPEVLTALNQVHQYRLQRRAES
jgi:4-alpha-glucanotransferase